MHDDETIVFDNEGRWKLPAGEEKRQAIDALKGYAYQLHQTAGTWIRLNENERLYVEVAEDYAKVIAPPAEGDETLEAFQVKSRESGSVTLNSADVLDAIRNLYALQQKNAGREVRLTFLTTAEYGKEKKNPLASGEAGLAVWQSAATGGSVTELRKALEARFQDGAVAEFIRVSTDDQLRERLIEPLRFLCGQATWGDIEKANQDELVAQRAEVDATPDDAKRAYDIIVGEVLRTVLKSKNRRLDRQMFLSCFRDATGQLVRIPSNYIEAVIQRELRAPRPMAVRTAMESLAQIVDRETGIPLPTDDRLFLIKREALEIVYRDDIVNALGKLRDRQEKPEVFFDESATLRELKDDKVREDRAASLLAFTSELTRKANKMMEDNVKALGVLVEWLERLSAPNAQIVEALDTFTKLAALYLIKVLKQGFDWREGRAPRQGFEAYKFNSDRSYCLFDWTPRASPNGKTLFGFRYWVGARVGLVNQYEYVMFPLSYVLPLFRKGVMGDSEAFFKWVLPQLAIERADIRAFPVQKWEPFLLQGASGEEWWSRFNPCPWPEVVNNITTAEY